MTTASLTLDVSPEGNLSRYLRQIHQYPMLERFPINLVYILS